MRNQVHRSIRILALCLALVLSSLGLAVLGPVNTARADSLGYPDASMPCIYHPYATDGSGYWCDGYSWGSTRDKVNSIWSPRGYAYRNCTDYVAWKLQSLGVPSGLTSGLGNGGQWYDKAGAKANLKRGTSPQAGAAAVKPTSVTDAYGHVAYVESVHPDGKITVSEYNYDLGGHGNKRTGTPGSMGFTKFVYFGEHMTNPPGGGSGTTEQTPPHVPWNFENLEGDSGAVGPHSSDVGRTPAAVEFNGQLYVFHYDVNYGDLRYARTSPGWVFDILDGAGGANGRTTSNVGQNPTAVVFNNQLHVFYYDAGAGNLRHAVSSDGVYWSFENLDGDWGSIGGLDGNTGQTPTAVVFGASLQVFYYDAGWGNLRHAWWSSGQWYFETLEGDPGSISHYNTNIGLDPAAVVYSNTLQLFYYDVSAGNLRHAWVGSNGWNFENLDGDLGSVGGLNADVGSHPSMVVYAGNLHVFYYDQTNGNFRHMWADVVGWHAENLEGDIGSVTGYNGDVGTMSTALVLGNTLQVFVYEAGGGNLRHLLDSGTGWQWENLDGQGGSPAGRLNATVGLDPVAIPFGGGLQLFYYDYQHGNLRHALPQ